MQRLIAAFTLLLMTGILLLILGLSRASLAAPQRSSFDHLTTGFELTGRHRDLQCEECHANALFKGTPRECSACHGVGTRIRATAKSVNHILSTEQCDSCHATVAWIPAVNFDHAQTHGSCSTCHNNVQAPGKPPQHISTNLECDVCHSTISWSGAVFNHEGVSGGCAQCHNGVTATGIPNNHIPTGGAPCESCHAPTNFSTFAGTAMNHSVVAGMPCVNCHEAGKTFVGVTITTRPPAPHPATGDCSTCHSSTSTFGGLANLPPNHIPTSQPCSQCHSNQADFSIYAMSHQGITSGCANCHGAGLSFINMAPPTLKVIPANHIPTGSTPCESCHSTTNFTTFAGTAMNHTVVTGTSCSSCHEAGKSFVGSPPIVTRPPAPHVATGECSNCHFSTTSFSGAQAMPANHIPVPAADGGNCALCHTNANDYSIYTMNHNGIANNCAQCHGAGMAFANIAPPALKEPPTGPPAHIPTGNVACEMCHSPTNFTTFAGTIIKHAAVAGRRCDSCHELGMSWYGISNLWVRDGPNHHKGQDCGGSGCHSPRDTSGGGRANAVIMRAKARTVTAAAVTPAGGPSATRTAATVTGPNPAVAGRGGMHLGGTIAPADRSVGAFGSVFAATDRGIGPLGSSGTPGGHHRDTGGARCSTCHSSSSHLGISRLHAWTTTSCENCHTTLAWLPVSRVDHTQAKGACANCHNGINATGISRRHVAVTRGCDSCHTTIAWTPARFDHAAATAQPCTSCHNGVQASGLPRNHIPVTKQCSTCHGTLSWTSAKIDHSNLTTSCSGCHNNVGAVGKPASHMVTSRDCQTCHTYPDWNAVRFRHTSPQYPGQHRAALTCEQCHTTNTERIVFASPADGASCGGCHAKDFEPAVHPKTLKGQLYSASELADCTGACHVYTDATKASIARSVRSPHHRVIDASFRH